MSEDETPAKIEEGYGVKAEQDEFEEEPEPEQEVIIHSYYLTTLGI